MAWLTLALFIGLLFFSVVFGLPLIPALLGGYVLFFLYGLYRKHSPVGLWRMSLRGLKTVGKILFLFLLIGMITALWRACGTIPFLIYHAAGLISPALFFLLAFLLCALVSYLTGTSFGTAATMGVICMSMGTAMGLSPVLSAGAILSGAFFGDRCSPMSTSALLVAALTKTDIYRNIALMVRTAAVPFALTCGIYLCFGFRSSAGGFSRDLLEPFAGGFRLHWLTVLPAVVIVVLSLLKRSVRLTMALSILCAGVLCVTLQGMTLPELGKTALLGFQPESEALRPLLSGGGAISMVKPLCIVSISSTYSGLFEGTGLLEGMKTAVSRLAERLTPFGSLFLVSVGTCIISCNQTLAIMLSHSLFRENQSPRDLAVGLEDTAVVLAPLVPWSIAGAVPLASVGAPAAALLGACYLYLIPLWNLLVHLVRRSKQQKRHQGQGEGAEDGA